MKSHSVGVDIFPVELFYLISPSINLLCFHQPLEPGAHGRHRLRNESGMSLSQSITVCHYFLQRYFYTSYKKVIFIFNNIFKKFSIEAL